MPIIRQNLVELGDVLIQGEWLRSLALKTDTTPILIAPGEITGLNRIVAGDQGSILTKPADETFIAANGMIVTPGGALMPIQRALRGFDGHSSSLQIFVASGGGVAGQGGSLTGIGLQDTGGREVRHSRQRTIEGIHIPYHWLVADAIGRNTVVATVDDVGKLARQIDDDTLWLLVSYDPLVWVSVSVPFGILPAISDPLAQSQDKDIEAREVIATILSALRFHRLINT